MRPNVLSARFAVNLSSKILITIYSGRLASLEQNLGYSKGSDASNSPVDHLREPGASAQRSAPARVDAMSSVAARSLGTSPSAMRPISPYLKVPPLAHSTTSPMA